jgi:hypothetical protein
VVHNFVKYIQQAATGKKVLSLLVPAMVVYALMLVYTIPQVEHYSAGMKLFDLSPFGYSYQYAIELLSALGSTGRATYLYRQLPLDFVYPGLFPVSFCLLQSWLFAKILRADSKMFSICLVPLTAGLFDYLENICIVFMLTSFPNVSEMLVAFASTFTIAKSTFTTACFVFLAIGCLLFIRKIRNNTQTR